ncbi:MAG: hypothetical protein J3Q66DRAFT_12390 [Benniella sp.]|nr:MAG: hypothetical protein J3Q66DRAFT_12390 [Benniella sp.]
MENEYDDMINTHYAQPNTTTYITIAPRVLSYLRDDFLGFFNVHNKTTETVVTTTVEDLNTPGVTEFQLMIPTSWELSDELLLLSIPEAFASWGGVFSLTVALFYLLFGKGRPSPFGFIQTYLMGSSTKRKIQEMYYKDRGDVESNNNGEPGMSSPIPRNITIQLPSHGEVGDLEQDQQQDLNLLREFVRGEIEYYLDTHQRLMKDMFLNMRLVDDALRPPSSN